MSATGLRETALAWIADDPDPATREELAALLEDPSPEAEADLADRFGGRLRFGTAGLRGVVAAGPNRMNRAVVRMATAALAGWLKESQPGSQEAGVAIGCDARHGSAEFTDETIRVLTGAGFRVHVLPQARPTPLLAFSVVHLKAAAGVMITASHNPPRDNGYKLYLSDGAQVIPPVDGEIERRMASIGPLSDIPLGDPAGPLVTRHGPDTAGAYLDALANSIRHRSAHLPIRIAYTPLHGIALGVFQAALERAGYPPARVVAAQAQPDPDFPTVAFPNPEEPGAMDLVLAVARELGADVAIANDPDGDRLAVAVPDREAEGGWRVLTGDQVGALIGGYVLDLTAAEPDPGSRLVATSVVSSSLLSKIAAAAGARYAETLTGFKWIARAADQQPGSRFVFGYEEALGYSVGTTVRDKDGVGAAIAFLGLVSRAMTRGRSVLSYYDELERAHGVHLTSQLSLRTITPAATTSSLRSNPPSEIGGHTISEQEDLLGKTDRHPDLPATDLLIYRTASGARIAIRPSGTEPKLKAYIEVVRPLAGESLEDTRRLASSEMALLRGAVSDLLS